MSAKTSTTVHVTSIRNGGVYGHSTKHCDEGGCAGDEMFWEGISPDDVDEQDIASIGTHWSDVRLLDVRTNKPARDGDRRALLTELIETGGIIAYYPLSEGALATYTAERRNAKREEREPDFDLEENSLSRDEIDWKGFVNAARAKGGATKSAAKTRTAQANGARGGRPRKQ